MEKYIGTIIVAAVLVLVVGFVIYRMIKDRKSGKGCTGNCASCGGHCSHASK